MSSEHPEEKTTTKHQIESKNNNIISNLKDIAEEEPIIEEKVIVMEQVIIEESPAVTESHESIEISNLNNNNVCVEKESIKSSENEVRDGNYFLKVLMVEKLRILKLADETEKELEVLQSDVRFSSSTFTKTTNLIAFLACYCSNRRSHWHNSLSNWQVTLVGYEKV